MHVWRTATGGHVGCLLSWVVLLSAFVLTASSVQLGVCGRLSRLRCQMLLSELPFAFGEAVRGALCVSGLGGVMGYGVSANNVWAGGGNRIYARGGALAHCSRGLPALRTLCVYVCVCFMAVGRVGTARCAALLCCAVLRGQE
jgi:hypothetical protein